MASDTQIGFLQLSVMITYKIIMRENFVHGIIGNPRSRSATDRGCPTMRSWVLLAGTCDVAVDRSHDKSKTQYSISNQKSINNKRKGQGQEITRK